MTYLASSAGALIVDRNAWHTRADSAWGSSRIWNNGSSFEADLAAMTTDRNTWQSRANQAWGASRTWGSGESWEAAYNRVLPPTGDVFANGTVALNPMTGAFQSCALTESNDPSGLTSVAGSVITLSKTGNYVIACKLSGSYGVGNGDVNLRLLVNGSPTAAQQVQGARGWAIDYYYRAGTLAAGATVQVQAFGTGGTTSPVNGSWELLFIPNQTYPH